jgi:hypothetical protein
MENQHDDALDKVLAALRNAAPPEGMDARIAQRLHATATPTALASSTLAGAWWRGAIAGAASAMLATGLFALAFHLLGTRAATIQTTADVTLYKAASPNTATRVSTPRELRATLCTSPALLRAQNSSPTPFEKSLRAETRIENAAPSYPAPALPLTAQERALAQLARTADPKQLASLTPEQEAKVDAEKAAEFARFFAHPSPPPNPDAHPGANLDASPDANSQTVPDANPDTTPQATPDADPQANQSNPDANPEPDPAKNEPNPSLTKEEE